MKETKFKQTLVQTKDERRKTKEGTRHCEERSDVAIQSGFKMTEVGLIPNDWNLVEISELAKDMADGPFGSNLKKEHYTSDPQVRIIQLSNIGECGWENENTKYTTFEHAKTIARCIVPKEESILVAKMMPAGRAIICPKTEKQYILGSDVIRITANEKLNSKYFVYATKSQAYLKQISDNTQGSTRQRTSISKLRKIAMPLPIFKEQQRIANALSDVDTLIANLEKLIAKKKNIKQGAMQQLLTGKKRLPGFAPAKPTYKQTELGKIPADWEFEIFGKLVSIYRGGSPRPIEAYITTNPSGINWIKIGDVDEGAKYITSTQERIIPEGKSRSREVHKGDFILSNSMSFGRPYILKVDGCIHDGWLTIQDYQDTFDTDFLYYMLSSEVVFNQYVSMAAGSSVQNLNKEKVAAVKLFYPPSKTEQTAIANVLSDMDTEISALETKLAKYRTLKTGMMQQLLTGKIRLV